MYIKRLLFTILLVSISLATNAQTGIVEKFNDNTLSGWNIISNGSFNLEESDQELKVDVATAGPGFENFEFNFSAVDLSDDPTLEIIIKSEQAFDLRVDLKDVNGNSTNTDPVIIPISGDNTYTTYSFDFTNKFTQSFPSNASVNDGAINTIVFLPNAGGSALSNTRFSFDSLRLGNAEDALGGGLFSGQIRINQVGYELNAPKVAVLESSSEALTETTFTIIDAATGSIVYINNISENMPVDGWSGRNFYQADFSSFSTPGTYRLEFMGTQSYEFEISENIYFEKTAFSIVDFFKGMRSTLQADNTLSFNGDRSDEVNVYGGWIDATGDPGKHMSHLSYGNYFNPQQIPMVVWSLLKSYEMNLDLFTGKEQDLTAEAAWGADYILRNIDPEGYLYLSIFDDWGNSPGSREITEWGQPGNNSGRTPNYQAAFREGAGIAIAALARASYMNLTAGDSTATQYLNGAITLFQHLNAPGDGYATKNLEYDNDHTENIIDDYCALMAAIELYRATNEQTYLDYASQRADNILSRLNAQGWLASDDAGERPFFHAADEGLPIVALLEYMEISSDKDAAIRDFIESNLDWYFSITNEVTNPFNYIRQYHRPYTTSMQPAKTGFFVPHDNETGYWWQGENARLSSMTTALLMAANKLNMHTIGSDSLTRLAMNQLDWIMGKNPFGICMIYGYGSVNYPDYPVASAIPNIVGGICNGITAMDADENDLEWMPYDASSWQNWRWIEQWLPHNAWYMLAVSSISRTLNEETVVEADFIISEDVCYSDTIVFTDASIGNITSWEWDFGEGAVPATATGPGPHKVKYSSGGEKSITLSVNNGEDVSIKSKSLFQEALAVSSSSSFFPCPGDNVTVNGIASNPLWITPSGERINQSVLSLENITPGDSGTYLFTSSSSNVCPNDTIEIVIAEMPYVNFIKEDTLVCEGAAIQLTYDASPQSAQLTVSNTDAMINQNTVELSAVNPGEEGYLILTAEWDGCTFKDSVFISVSQIVAPQVSIQSSPENMCQSDNVTLEANGTNLGNNPVYEWNLNGSLQETGSNATYNFSPVATQNTVLVTVTPDVSCPESVSDSVIINQVEPVDHSVAIISDKTTYCPGESVVFSVSNSQGSTYFQSYQWFLNDAPLSGENDEILNLTNGLMSTDEVKLQVEVNGPCLSDQGNKIISEGISVSVDEGNEPQITIAASKEEICEGEAVLFELDTYSPVSAPVRYYQWMLNGQPIPAADGLSFTTSSLNPDDQVSLAWGISTSCAGDIEVQSNVADLIINPAPSGSQIVGPAEVCALTIHEYTLENAMEGSTFLWSITGGSGAATSNKQNPVNIFFGQNDGALSVVETSLNGCIGEEVTRAITVNEVPVTSDIMGPAEVCPTSSNYEYSVQENEGNVYTWSLNDQSIIESSNTITLNGGNFLLGLNTLSVRESSINGCLGNPKSLQISNLAPNDVSQISFTASDDTICTPDQVTGAITIEPQTEPGEYFFTVNDQIVFQSLSSTYQYQNLSEGDVISGGWTSPANECYTMERYFASEQLSITSFVNQEIPIISGPTDIVCNGSAVYEVLNYDGSDNLNWSVDGGAIINTVSGNSIEVQFGTDDAKVSVFAVPSVCTTDVSELQVDVCVLSTTFDLSGKGIKVYPNPVDDQLFIDFGNNSINQIELYNNKGYLLKIEPAGSNIRLPEGLASGVYYLKLIGEKDTFTVPIMKQ